MDSLGRYGITGAGIMVLLSVGLIIVFLMLEALPLLTDTVKHHDATLNKMFVPQVYDGYQETQYLWQTDTADGGQAKYSVALLIFGTLKGAFWAMVFSVPLALLSALFISEFAKPRVRLMIKSSIEVLASIPTVVVGCFAFITLSTLLNNYYAQHTAYFIEGRWVLFMVQIFAFCVGCSALVGNVTVGHRSKIQKCMLSLLAILLTFGIVFVVGRLVESVLGTTLQPLFGITRYNQLNGMVAGFCLGFAIIPVIFSVAEDAMRAVPNSYREASLALGGSKWETALRVVLPSALPGVYAAIMLGLARAVGETMIVLMASGNTAIWDLSPFTGMRTMSAAIAIEASEKAKDSTGYHVLFFVGALLFLITFVLNAVTAHVIENLKKRYQ
jgi:phosphate transport system permease protein